MAISNFIPKVWSSNLMAKKDKSHVFAALATREFEGDITRFGDTVQISQVGDVTISTYTPNSTSISPEELQDTASLLKIDQAKYFAFYIEDIENAQSKPKVMQEAMRRSAYKVKDAQDSYMAGLYATAGIAQNTNASPVDMTSTEVMEEFLAVGESLDEANASRDRRFAAIPPWVMGKLVIAGVSSLTENKAEFQNGFLGRAYGFNFYLSNNISKNSSSWDKSRIICGVEQESLAVAEQIVSLEAYRPEDGFQDAVKGLLVYGGKIIRPDITAVLYADKTAEA